MVHSTGKLLNTLLANGEVLGLFEGDKYTTLMTQCKEGARERGQC